MMRGFCWLLATAVTLAVFCIVLWLSAVLMLPLWVSSAGDRWVIGVGMAGAAAAVAALWGASIAGREPAEKSEDATAGSVAGARNVWMNASATGGTVNQVAGDQTINGQLGNRR